MILLALATLALLMVFVVTLARSSLAPKGQAVAYIAIALGVPLLALWTFLANGYRHWNWAPFHYGSLAPHVLAGLTSVALLFVVLRRVTGSLAAKLVIGSAPPDQNEEDVELTGDDFLF